MLRLLKKIGIISTMLLLIAATGGFSVYQHFCTCQGEVITSVFMEIECGDDAPAETSSCCAATSVEKSCCDSKPAKSCKSGQHSESCCHTNSTFLKIQDNFTSAQVKFFTNVDAFASDLFGNEVLLAEAEPLAEKAFLADASPPFSGKQILLKIHQLKLAPDLA